jgi:hypothetical protein
MIKSAGFFQCIPTSDFPSLFLNTFRQQKTRKPQSYAGFVYGGDKRDRTADLLNTNQQVIGTVYRKCVRDTCIDYNYGDYFGDAAVALCEAAKKFTRKYDEKRGFYMYALTYLTYDIRKKYWREYRYQREKTSLESYEDDFGDDHDFGSVISDPNDDFEMLEYKILVESVCQKVGKVLLPKEKEFFQLWLYGFQCDEIARFLCFKRAGLPSIPRLKKKVHVEFMKTVVLRLNVDPQKYAAAEQFIEEKGLNIEQKLNETVSKFYYKCVPAPVRKYIEKTTPISSLPTNSKPNSANSSEAFLRLCCAKS